MSEKGKLSYFYWTATHLEHRFKLFKRLGDDELHGLSKEKASFHTRDLWIERVGGLLTKIEKEIQVILPFLD
ncbi:hypothetical protein K4K52_003168 [Colletotrichum sp. SAR 10_76]|nr:hypothetical protein K4K52_003168 [Colletotrichum sp. SAR 10_76]